MSDIQQVFQPVIVETERTRLRPHCLTDFDDIAALWSDPTVLEFISPTPLRRSEAWTRLLRYIGHWSVLPYGYWVIEDKQTGEFLGEVGFADWKREIEPSLEGLPEIGWLIKPSAQGKGLATEAVKAALHWGDSHISAKDIVSIIHQDHQKSINIARKVGFGEPEIAVFMDSPTLLFRKTINLSCS